jgi:alkanesulfonate monooxygenase SsuD/methylene tetrahydromethanopterin reductase-like flavin-dependent oxidoreductase (luciferase family)
MQGLACSATPVLIGHIAAATKTIRVGSGGVMLPNHSPLVVAEQFGTLEAIYPGRIDLGVGRAPGKIAVSIVPAATMRASLTLWVKHCKGNLTSLRSLRLDSTR